MQSWIGWIIVDGIAGELATGGGSIGSLASTTSGAVGLQGILSLLAR
jgi:hypothetical protein